MAMKDKYPSMGYVVLAKLLAKIRNDLVITTNFNDLLADTLRLYCGIKPLVIGHESLARFIEISAKQRACRPARACLYFQQKEEEESINAIE